MSGHLKRESAREGRKRCHRSHQNQARVAFRTPCNRLQSGSPSPRSSQVSVQLAIPRDAQLFRDSSLELVERVMSGEWKTNRNRLQFWTRMQTEVAAAVRGCAKQQQATSLQFLTGPMCARFVSLGAFGHNNVWGSGWSQDLGSKEFSSFKLLCLHLQHISKPSIFTTRTTQAPLWQMPSATPGCVYHVSTS